MTRTTWNNGEGEGDDEVARQKVVLDEPRPLRAGNGKEALRRCSGYDEPQEEEQQQPRWPTLEIAFIDGSDKRHTRTQEAGHGGQHQEMPLCVRGFFFSKMGLDVGIKTGPKETGRKTT